MPDVKVNVPGVASGHLDYDVPGGAEFVLRQAYASYDGSGAASSWLPALQLIGPDGNVAGTYVPGSSQAAGASADVTFAPFLGRGAGGASGAAGLPNAIMENAGFFTISANTTFTVPLDTGVFGTTDTTIYGAIANAITITQPGLYAAYAHLLNDGTPFPTQLITLSIEWLNTGSGSGIEWVTPRRSTNALSGFSGPQPNNVSPEESDYLDNISWAYVGYATASRKTRVEVAVTNEDAVNTYPANCYLIVTQLQPIASATVLGFPEFP